MIEVESMLAANLKAFDGYGLEDFAMVDEMNLSDLMDGGLEDEGVFEIVLELVVAQSMRFGYLAEHSRDMYEMSALANLKAIYDKMLMEPTAVGQQILGYAREMSDYLMSIGKAEEAQRWGEISLAIWKTIQS